MLELSSMTILLKVMVANSRCCVARSAVVHPKASRNNNKFRGLMESAKALRKLMSELSAYAAANSRK